MDLKFGSWWRKIQLHPVRSVVIIATGALVIAFIVVIILGYWLNWSWIGVNGGFSKITTTSTTRGITITTEQQLTRTLWDWLQLLIIPAVLAIGGFWLNQIQKAREEKESAQRARIEHEAAEQRAQTDREIALDNQREIALQGYIDKMSELLLKERLRESELEDEIRKIARVRTLAVLKRLDAKRNGSVLQFLYEARLYRVYMNESIIDLSHADLSGVDFGRADLSGAELYEANLSGANLSEANLSSVDFRKANLSHANLNHSDLNHANLSHAQLCYTDLSGVDLRGANLNEADLSHANLSEALLGQTQFRYANLSGVNFKGADFRSVNLEGASLKDATNITTGQLDEAYLLRGAIMPDGLEHP